MPQGAPWCWLKGAELEVGSSQDPVAFTGLLASALAGHQGSRHRIGQGVMAGVPRLLPWPLHFRALRLLAMPSEGPLRLGWGPGGGLWLPPGRCVLQTWSGWRRELVRWLAVGCNRQISRLRVFATPFYKGKHNLKYDYLVL